MATPGSEPTGSRAEGVAPTFAKYRERRAYHWREASLHPIDGWPYTRARMAWVARQCATSRTILEIGCGDGALLARLAQGGTTVAGVDVDETAIELATRMFERQGLRGEFFTDLRAVEHRRFDAVVLAEVIEHLDDARRFGCSSARSTSITGTSSGPTSYGHWWAATSSASTRC